MANLRDNIGQALHAKKIANRKAKTNDKATSEEKQKAKASK